MRYSIFVVEDHDPLRQILGQMIQSDSELELCGESASAEEAQGKIVDTRPDLVLMDIILKG